MFGLRTIITVITFALAIISPEIIIAFSTSPSLPNKIITQRHQTPKPNADTINETYNLTPNEHNDALDDLLPPAINFYRDSMLFSDNPNNNRRSNVILHFWRRTKSTFPRIVTGAWRESTGEENPIGALYNMVFVRMPVLCALGVYLRNCSVGHPLVVDLGNGPFEISPLVVVGVLFLILGPSFIENEGDGTS
mmetsp:Transcript_51976/g.62524  ORF Transcript_51976/g.62524 Transcript_51976/m.62524 type:complete len:193 (-) Transcript_51976:38-616(-)|eukprot:CAMPEP_0172504422 /NCGR_PEP_ID=MMETSP1066-20121228/178617_1 /TAXON_ID=671091 /ORGANISM="Coscinodiscus wailesii, Strain CCMP2513" /LENGTH=192 /DNA_ID=CAMNT_0013280607 /DNA_START=66 /DNA_END=644 /DNA_ORIENTATION=+